MERHLLKIDFKTKYKTVLLTPPNVYTTYIRLLVFIEEMRWVCASKPCSRADILQGILKYLGIPLTAYIKLYLTTIGKVKTQKRLNQIPYSANFRKWAHYLG